MSRLFWLALIALGVALYFPESRGWLMEKAQPVINPVLRTATLSEMERIVGDLHTSATENFGRYPEPREFARWVERRYTGGATDSWDNAYELEDLRRDGRMQLRSWGPDRLRGTEDDILVEFRRGRR